MTPWTIEAAVDALLHAEATRTDRAPLTDTWPELDPATGYAIQDQLIARKVAAGQHIVGVKLGLTSRAKQERMGIDSPLTAWLTDAMLLPAGTPVPTGLLIHPRIEPEIVFRLGRRLQGPGLTSVDVLAAVDTIHGGLEIIDSRFTNFHFALSDVVADNASAARIVLGTTGAGPDRIDLALEACLLHVDGSISDTATGAAVQGHPADALAHAANALSARRIALEAGWLVYTGGLTDAVPLQPGRHITAEYTNLGTVTAVAA